MNLELPRIYLVRHGETASLSVLGYDHDLTEPVIHVWNGDVTAASSGP